MLVPLSLLSLTLAAATVPAATSGGFAFPDQIAWRGLAYDADGAPLSGRFAVELAYFDGAGEQRVPHPSGTELLRERHETVDILAGRFTLELGTGAVRRGRAPAAVDSLRELLARHPEVGMEVTIGGVRQDPRVTILSAGHSLESRLVLAGRAAPDDDEPHSKGYRYRSSASAVQAVALRPAAPGASSRPSRSKEGSGPFEIALHGPWRSRPLRELRAAAAAPRSEVAEPEEVNRIRHEDLFDAGGVRFGTGATTVADPLVPLSSAPSPLRTPEPIRAFEGVGNLSSLLPPDPIGAVGPDHYVQMVNVNFQVFLKDGTSAGGPYPTNALWSGYGGPCELENDGDPIVLYDRYAGRWILSQFAIPSGSERVCLAISQSSDPLGSYELYELETQRFPDYFKLGVWPDPENDAIFLTTNSGYQGAYDVYALDRANMLAGLTARPAIFFQSFKNLLMPADANGATLPPPGSPGLLYTFRDGGQAYFGSPPADSLDLYSFHVDWDVPASSTMTLTQSFTAAGDGFADFNWTICGFFVGDCLPQPGTAQRLDSASWWPMHRFQYRRFADHEALVGTWTIDVTGVPDHAAPRWFELRRSGGPWSIHQQGTHAPDAAQRWMPSIAMDGDGNIALGYSTVDAGNALYPSIRYATRAAGDPPGTLHAERTLVAGGGAQTHSSGRWGDYSSMTVDPTDDCTFWYTNEYLASTGSAPWQTRVGAFTYPGCGGIAAAPSFRRICGLDSVAEFSFTLSPRFDGTTDLAVSGCPAQASCQFDLDPVVAPATSSTLVLSDLEMAASGVYEVVVEAAELGNPADTFETVVALDLWSATPGPAVPSAPANAASGQPVRPSFTWDAAVDGESYTLEVATDPAFSNLAYTATIPGTSHTPAVDLPSSGTLYWRVRATNPCGPGVESPISWFETLALPGDCPAGKTPEPAYSYGFESGANGWSSSGTGNSWAQSGAVVYSGTASWHADDPGVVTDQRLVSPAIALPAGQPPLTLAFWHWRSIEDPTGCWDGALLEISTDDGSSWTQLTTGLATDPYDGTVIFGFGNPLAGTSAWCGDQGWTRSVVALDDRAGQSVRFGFRLGSDNYPLTTFDGWYLDNVDVSSCVVSPIVFADGFEIANATRWSATEP